MTSSNTVKSINPEQHPEGIDSGIFREGYVNFIKALKRYGRTQGRTFPLPGVIPPTIKEMDIGNCIVDLSSQTLSNNDLQRTLTITEKEGGKDIKIIQEPGGKFSEEGKREFIYLVSGKNEEGEMETNYLNFSDQEYTNGEDVDSAADLLNILESLTETLTKKSAELEEAQREDVSEETQSSISNLGIDR